MLTKNKNLKINNEEGTALIEALPLLIIFIVLLSYGLGMWGSIHRGILNSVAARNYAFQTFRNRTDISFHSDYSIVSNDTSVLVHYQNVGFRFHFSQSSQAPPDNRTYATKLPIALGRGEQLDKQLAERGLASGSGTHNRDIHALGPRNRGVEVNPIWVMVGYGMCVNAACGGN